MKILSSLVLSSMILLSNNVYGADFEYPEDETTDSWALESVLGAGVANYCGLSHLFQSPIDIDTSSANLEQCSSPLSWTVNTEINTFKVKNTGHNLQVVPVCCGISNDDSGSEESGESDSDDDVEAANVESGTNFGELTDNFNYIGGSKYCLDSFHIHWGQTDETGSEHCFNQKQYVMEMHFVHFQCDHKSFEAALKAYDPNTDIATLAVVSVLYEIGAENPLIKEIVNKISSLQTVDGDGITITSSGIDMFDVIPMNNGEIMGNYYHYRGSLTTPPCTPAVSWHVLDHTLTISESQLNSLRHGVLNEHQTLQAPNFRGVKTNNNKIYKCSASTNGSDESGEDD